MENSPWLSPGLLVAVALAAIGFIAWLIRLESKVNGTDKAVTKLDQSVEDTWKDLEHHRTNEGVHFNQRLANEVEQRQKDRMDRMAMDIAEIKGMVKEIANR